MRCMVLASLAAIVALMEKKRRRRRAPKRIRREREMRRHQSQVTAATVGLQAEWCSRTATATAAAAATRQMGALNCMRMPGRRPAGKEGCQL